MDRLAMLKDVLRENPNDAFARYGLAMEYAKSGNIETALDEFKKIIIANPDYTPAYQMAGQTLVTAGRLEEARKMFEGGIQSAQRAGNQHAADEMQGMLDELPV